MSAVQEHIAVVTDHLARIQRSKLTGIAMAELKRLRRNTQRPFARTAFRLAAELAGEMDEVRAGVAARGGVPGDPQAGMRRPILRFGPEIWTHKEVLFSACKMVGVWSDAWFHDGDPTAFNFPETKTWPAMSGGSTLYITAPWIAGEWK